MRRDADRLRDILEAIDAIRSRVGLDRSPFDADAMVRVWCLHHLTIIGEATAGLSQQIREKYTNVPWRSIVGMRNAIIHAYFDVDWDEVWIVVERDIDALRRTVKAILDDVEAATP